MNAHAIIIGAGPAGSACAFALASRGVDVLVIERSTFPRAKVCGEYISPACTDILESIVPAGRLLRAGAKRTTRVTLEAGGRRLSWETPRPAWALSRAMLDSLLLEAAARAGARIEQPASVRGVRACADRVEVSLADGRRLAGAVVIHADGSGRHDAAGAAPAARGVLGHKCHLRVPPGRIEGVVMRSAAGAYVGMIEVEEGLATCALTARRELIGRFAGDADAMLRAFWPEYDPAWRVGEWMSCAQPRGGYVRPGGARSFRVGNAAAAVDPVGGEGIGLALWSGVAAGELIAESVGDAASLACAERRLARLYGARLRRRLPACRVTAEVLMRPRLVRLLWPMLRVRGLGIDLWYTATGKSGAAGGRLIHD